MKSVCSRIEAFPYLLLFLFANTVTWQLRADPLSNCQEDLKKLCNATLPGPPNQLKCLKAHIDVLSLGCQRDVRSMKLHFTENRHLCEKDIEKLCPQILPGNGRIFFCLRRQFKKLSTECAMSIKQHIAKQIK